MLLNPLIPWDPSYIPVFSFQGEWFGAYCGSKTRESGPVVHYFLEDEARVTAINLTTFIASMAEAFESGVISWSNGGMKEDIHRLREIHTRHNPGFDFPYYVPDGP